MVDGKEPAFPHQFEDVSGHNRYLQSQGMSQRTLISALMLGSVLRHKAMDERGMDWAVATAVYAADRLLARLKGGVDDNK